MAILRRLEVTGTITATDHETFGANERGSLDVRGVNFVGPHAQAATVVNTQLGVGGEVRVELKLTTNIGPIQIVAVEGEARLYEGDSEWNGDLEDDAPIFIQVAPAQTLQHRMFLTNGGQGDRAEITLLLTNGDALAEVARRGGTALTARHSGKVLDVAGASMDAGASIIQFATNGGANQRVRIEPVDDTFVRLIAVHSGLALDVAGASLADGAPLILFPWHGNDNQLFRLEPTNGDLVIMAKHSGKVLDVAGVSTQNGAPITQFTWNRGANQQWTF